MDEKIFTVKPFHNHQIPPQLLKKGPQKTAAAETIGLSYFLILCNGLGRICTTGKTLLVFIQRNVKINAANYLQLVLHNVLEPWVMQHFGPDDLHFSKTELQRILPNPQLPSVKNCFLGFWGKDIWVLNLLDLNPMDYSVWSILEQKVSATRYTTVKVLKTALMRAWDKIMVEQCAALSAIFKRDCTNVLRLLEAILSICCKCFCSNLLLLN